MVERRNEEPDTMANATIPTTMHSRNIKIDTSAVHSTIVVVVMVTLTATRIGCSTLINESTEDGLVKIFIFMQSGAGRHHIPPRLLKLFFLKFLLKKRKSEFAMHCQCQKVC